MGSYVLGRALLAGPLAMAAQPVQNAHGEANVSDTDYSRSAVGPG